MDKTIYTKNQPARFLVACFLIIFKCQAYAVPPVIKKQSFNNSPVTTIKAEHDHEIVVLIHGLLRSSLSMQPIEWHLEEQGYRVYTYSYPSRKYTIHEHAMDLDYFIENLLLQNPGMKIHFVTHSLGGIILREALSKLTKTELKNIGSLIMLAPPNQGSFFARLSTKIFPPITAVIKPLAELSSAQTSYVHQIPVPLIKIGIIAGRFDAKVPPSATHLKGQTDFVVINSNHTFIMNHAKTKRLITQFLEKGNFQVN